MMIFKHIHLHNTCSCPIVKHQPEDMKFRCLVEGFMFFLNVKSFYIEHQDFLKTLTLSDSFGPVLESKRLPLGHEISNIGIGPPGLHNHEFRFCFRFWKIKKMEDFSLKWLNINYYCPVLIY